MKSHYFSKMSDIDNNKLIGLLITGGGGLLLSQEHMKGEKEDNGYSLHLRQNFGILKTSIKIQFNYLFYFS